MVLKISLQKQLVDIKMRLIKILCFLLFLSSCNKYFGVIDSDYEPENELEDIFANDIIKKDQIINFDLKKIIYPYRNYQSPIINFKKLDKIFSLDKDKFFILNNDIIFLSINDKDISIYRSNQETEKLKIEVDLNKNEEIIHVSSHLDNLLILTNKSKLFLIDDNKTYLKADFKTFINSGIIQNDNKLMVFSVFGELLEIDLSSYSLIPKNNFIIEHGVIVESNNYEYNNLITHLYNSGTLLFLNRSNLDLEMNYFLDDLNILSSLGIFEEFLDAPFEFNENLYFIEKSGLISVFNPLASEILWEIDIKSSILDFNFTEDGKLLLLTINDILIFDSLGRFIFEIPHESEFPYKILANKNNIIFFDKNGISSFDLKTKNKTNIDINKFHGDIEILTSDKLIFIKDDKNLYKLSE